jgi:S-adenosylmethionine hydrolase
MKRMTNRPVIALITDFGFDDPFVGIMKGVISRISPQAQVIDINHAIPQGDIQRAAIQLWMARSHFPVQTTFLVVVDPGVGTERKAILVEDTNFRYVGPDNGLFSLAIEGEFSAWELSDPAYHLGNGSATFHGRDIFAPVAAHSANGVPGKEMGEKLRDILHIPHPKLQIKPDRISGEVIYNDRFGNLLTSLGIFTKSGERHYLIEPWVSVDEASVQEQRYQIDEATMMLPNHEKLAWVETFSDIPPAKCGILVGSTGLIEIAAFNRSAQALTKLTLGDPVTLVF